MKSVNRDLLVLTKRATSNKEAMEEEVEKLHQLLFHIECMSTFCLVNEIVDVNNYKIITNPVRIERIVRNNIFKPFQFISNKN